MLENAAPAARHEEDDGLGLDGDAGPEIKTLQVRNVLKADWFGYLFISPQVQGFWPSAHQARNLTMTNTMLLMDFTSCMCRDVDKNKLNSSLSDDSC